VDFVLKFTYLFERRKSSMQGKVPIKISAQFLDTQLPLLKNSKRLLPPIPSHFQGVRDTKVSQVNTSEKHIEALAKSTSVSSEQRLYVRSLSSRQMGGPNGHMQTIPSLGELTIVGNTN